jgi:hypothetical protein
MFQAATAGAAGQASLQRLRRRPPASTAELRQHVAEYAGLQLLRKGGVASSRATQPSLAQAWVAVRKAHENAKDTAQLFFVTVEASINT